MISVITTWPATSATSAALTAGRRRMSDSRGAAPSAASAAPERSASSVGSGRSRTNDRIAARVVTTPGTRYGPTAAGRPSVVATVPAGPTRFGPITAPTVETHTIVPIA